MINDKRLTVPKYVASCVLFVCWVFVFFFLFFETLWKIKIYNTIVRSHVSRRIAICSVRLARQAAIISHCSISIARSKQRAHAKISACGVVNASFQLRKREREIDVSMNCFFFLVEIEFIIILLNYCIALLLGSTVSTVRCCDQLRAMRSAQSTRTQLYRLCRLVGVNAVMQIIWKFNIFLGSAFDIDFGCRMCLVSTTVTLWRGGQSSYDNQTIIIIIIIMITGVELFWIDFLYVL